MNKEHSFRNMQPSTRVAVLVGLALIAFGLWHFVAALIPAHLWEALVHVANSITRFVWPMVLIVAGIFILWSVRHGKFDGFADRQTHGEFMRSRTDKRLAGVCGGIAYYFGVDSAMVRIMVVILFFLFPLPVVVAYVLMILLVPQA